MYAHKKQDNKIALHLVHDETIKSIKLLSDIEVTAKSSRKTAPTVL